MKNDVKIAGFGSIKYLQTSRNKETQPQQSTFPREGKITMVELMWCETRCTVEQYGNCET